MLPADAFSSDHNRMASSSRSYATPDVAMTIPIWVNLLPYSTSDVLNTLPVDAFSSDNNMASLSHSYATPDVAATIPIQMLTLAEIKDDSQLSNKYASLDLLPDFDRVIFRRWQGRLKRYDTTPGHCLGLRRYYGAPFRPSARTGYGIPVSAMGLKSAEQEPKGCDRDFSSSGYTSHVTRTTSTVCRTAYRDYVGAMQDGDDTSDMELDSANPPTFQDDFLEPEDDEITSFGPRTFRHDFFGEYLDEDLDWPDDMDEPLDDGQIDQDDELDDPLGVELEPVLPASDN
ncbi:hypothetical protein F5887DRAFT_924744 [Amanita rubescens]|nr:hypothetical protein F5887DRAFT_924744 [Amanita rubescens]